MPATEMVVAVAMVGGIALLIIAVLRQLNMVLLHRTIRKAMETNPALASSLLEKLTARRERAGDDRLAIILVAIGLAMAAAPMIAIDDRGIVRAAIAAALFPLLVGGALWLRFRAVHRAKLRESGE